MSYFFNCWCHYGQELCHLQFNNVRELVQRASPLRNPSRVQNFPTRSFFSISPETLWPAWISPDLTNLSSAISTPSFSVELKPKWGFMPSSSHDASLQTCRFCLHQHLKLSQGKVDRVSEFCPLDLFTSSERRMGKALHSLIATPQNNLRFICDGKLTDLTKLIQKVPNITPSTIVALISKTLLNAQPLLARLQAAQRLTKVSVSEACAMFESLTDAEHKFLDADILPEELCERICNKSTASDLLESTCMRTPVILTASSLASPIENYSTINSGGKLDELRRFMLSMTARDISIIITFANHSSTDIDFSAAPG